MPVTVNIPSQVVVQTAAQWAADATVYSAKRILVTSDVTYGNGVRKIKIADGSSAWSALNYFPGADLATVGAIVLTGFAAGANTAVAATDTIAQALAKFQGQINARATTSALTSHTSDTSNPHAVTQSQVGLGNVDNTSDANKPVSTAQQTALDAKTNKLITTNRQTDSYTLVLSDADKLVELNKATANNLTIPANSSVAFPVGTQILIAQYGAGQTTIVPGSATVRSAGGKLKLSAQYSGATLIKIATDEWYLFGDITT